MARPLRPARHIFPGDASTVLSAGFLDTVTTIFVDVTVGALLLLALPVVVVALRNAFAVLDESPTKAKGAAPDPGFRRLRTALLQDIQELQRRQTLVETGPLPPPPLAPNAAPLQTTTATEEVAFASEALPLPTDEDRPPPRPSSAAEQASGPALIKEISFRFEDLTPSAPVSPPAVEAPAAASVPSMPSSTTFPVDDRIAQSQRLPRTPEPSTQFVDEIPVEAAAAPGFPALHFRRCLCRSY